MTSRAQVPGKFINNWNVLNPGKSSRTSHGLSPLSRKPVTTACETCRLTKAKCTGGELCGRCSRRKMQCKYKNPTENTSIERQWTTSVSEKDPLHPFDDNSKEFQNGPEDVEAFPVASENWDDMFNLNNSEPNYFTNIDLLDDMSLIQPQKLLQVCTFLFLIEISLWNDSSNIIPNRASRPNVSVWSTCSVTFQAVFVPDPPFPRWDLMKF